MLYVYIYLFTYSKKKKLGYVKISKHGHFILAITCSLTILSCISKLLYNCFLNNLLPLQNSN